MTFNTDSRINNKDSKIHFGVKNNKVGRLFSFGFLGLPPDGSLAVFFFIGTLQNPVASLRRLVGRQISVQHLLRGSKRRNLAGQYPGLQILQR